MTGIAFKVVIPARSALIARMGHRGDTDQMPPLATKRVDEDGLAIVKRWIADLD